MVPISQSSVFPRHGEVYMYVHIITQTMMSSWNYAKSACIKSHYSTYNHMYVYVRLNGHGPLSLSLCSTVNSSREVIFCLELNRISTSHCSLVTTRRYSHRAITEPPSWPPVTQCYVYIGYVCSPLWELLYCRLGHSIMQHPPIARRWTGCQLAPLITMATLACTLYIQYICTCIYTIECEYLHPVCVYKHV